MSIWRADLHVHTVLSGCAEEEMLPPLLIERAQEIGLTLLGVVDHNSAGNAQAMWEAAEGSRVVVKPGLEVETRETVHLVCLFDEVDQARELQELVYAHLPSFSRAAAERSFGSQMLVSGEGLLVAHESRPLFAATDLSAEAVGEATREKGGLVIAAHPERRAHGLLGVLGFAPPELQLDGMEAGPGATAEGRLAASDAHRLAEIGARYTVFEATGTTVADLRDCLRAGAFRTGRAW